MAYEAKNYEHLLGKLKISDDQLKAHFTLYQGYVKKLNEIWEKLSKADRSTPNYSFNEYSELKRREPVAYNGTFLHEFYFENLTAAGKTQPTPSIKQRFADSYGSFDSWVSDFKAAAMSAHGWALLVYDPLDKKLKTNLVQSEHHVGLFVNTKVILALDVWEHAYAIQYGIKKADYVTAFFENLNWDAVVSRLA